MKNLWLKASIGVLPLAVASTLMAAGAIAPWTKADKKSYVAKKYLNSTATVQAVGATAGSGSETEAAQKLQVRVTLPAGTGSLTETTRYLGEVASGSQTPSKVTLKFSDANWKTLNDSSAGNLEITNWDKTNLTGKLLGYPISAEPVADAAGSLSEPEANESEDLGK